jgi:signal transduction histidine kinase
MSALSLHDVPAGGEAEGVEQTWAERVFCRQTAALVRTLDLLAAEPSLEAFLGHVLRAITEQLEAHSSALYLYDPDKEAVVLHNVCQDGRVWSGPQEPGPLVASQPMQIERENQAWQALNQTRAPLVFEDIPNHPLVRDDIREWAATYGIKTILLAPLLLDDRLVGTFSVRFPEPRRCYPEEKELAQALAHQATLAVQLTHLAKQRERLLLRLERNRMAGEIHDTLAQGLAGIILQLEAAEETLTETPEEASRHLHQARRLAQENLAEARRSVWALRPQALEQGDFVSALTHLVHRLTQETAMPVELSIHGAPRPLPPQIENDLLRVGQEALTNALKHARARAIRVTLTFSAEAVRLCMEDDGQGFDPERQPSHCGFGLRTMQERVERMGGHLTVASQPGQGTRVVVVVPLGGR